MIQHLIVPRLLNVEACRGKPRSELLDRGRRRLADAGDQGPIEGGILGEHDKRMAGERAPMSKEGRKERLR